ncbi:MAG: molybdopterin oxidoreductase family protein [Candidatus Brocadiaceae bacterium]|nr:molybdopterin oxidoreductase family protein [Candidatus Brocadiaceae bacterium]
MLVFWFQGYNHSTQAVFKNNTLHNLWLLTDNFCRPGAGPLSITGESNALGNRWVGGLSHLLPGMRMVANPQHRQELADFWKIPIKKIPPTPGKSIIEIIEGLHSGDIRALWTISANPAASLPDTKWVKEGLSKAELFIVQDIFHPTESSMMADVVLAGAHWFEKTGTFISSERRIELVEKIIEPHGNAKSDYDIVRRVALSMGFEKIFEFASSEEEVFEELKKITKGQICDMSGVTYERLRNKVGPQLPCPDPEHSGTKRLFTDKQFPRPDGRAALLPREYKPPCEVPNEEYPCILITGRLKCHFNTRTRTGRVPILDSNEPDNFVEINPDTASGLGIFDGDEVEVTSRRGTVRGAARISDSLLAKIIFMPMHFGNALSVGENRLANLLTNHVYDLHSKQPEYKYSVVKISKVEVG